MKSQKIIEILVIERKRVETEKKVEDLRNEIMKRKAIEKESKKKRQEKIEKLREKWAIDRWVTEYIVQNQARWDTRKENEIARYEKWAKMDRFERIKLLKRKYENPNGEIEPKEST